ncbi:aminotransferase class I/II-fold pyridoxal phosphate-dependent enzyme [Algiphilus sp.]|uniref:aminotransferase class I/II-fold pyridoxal phosphate-dependent enzyme n=1 Tax=Algiphilus sp. TaxID=1872431 RepID=UPI003B51F58E
MSASAQLDGRLQAEIEALEARALRRRRRVIAGSHGARIEVEGRQCANFCANDYLGLAADPRVAEAAQRALRDSGTGSGAAALVSGYNHEHRALEEALADFLGAEAALLFSSGWAANLGALRALVPPDAHLCADALNHASLIDGVRLTKAAYTRVAHADTAAFESAVRHASGPAWMVTDGVFSMDGDSAPLAALATIGANHGALLYVDDAHGFGVCGPEGRGSLAAAGLSHAEVPVYVATLGKALGASGAFVAGSRTLIDYLVQKARTWVFSTAPPPAMAAAARAALAILRSEPEHLQSLHANIAHFRRGAAQRGIPLGPPEGTAADHAIQPLVLGDAERTMAASAALFERGYWVAGIRPPTVPEGTSRLRITLSAAHRHAEIEGLLDALHSVLLQQAAAA